jgi:hypothetical protein
VYINWCHHGIETHFTYTQAMLRRFQNPAEGDALMRVQADVDETTIVLVSQQDTNLLSYMGGQRDRETGRDRDRDREAESDTASSLRCARSIRLSSQCCNGAKRSKRWWRRARSSAGSQRCSTAKHKRPIHGAVLSCSLLM